MHNFLTTSLFTVGTLFSNWAFSQDLNFPPEVQTTIAASSLTVYSVVSNYTASWYLKNSNTVVTSSHVNRWIPGGAANINAFDKDTTNASSAIGCHNKLLTGVLDKPTADYIEFQYSRCSPHNNNAVNQYSINGSFPPVWSRLYMQCHWSKKAMNWEIHQIEFTFEWTAHLRYELVNYTAWILSINRWESQLWCSGGAIIDINGTIKWAYSADLIPTNWWKALFSYSPAQ